MPLTTDDEFVAVATESIEDADLVTVTIDRPEAANSLPEASVDAIADLFERLDADDGDVVVIRSTGDEFCTGADLAEVHPVDEAAMTDAAARLQRLVRAIRECPLVVLAQVDGLALGGGFHLCLGADLVYAAEDAALGLPEVRFGIPVAGYATTLLPRIVGERRAREWLLAGETIPAAEAAAAGFVTEAVPADELPGTVRETAATVGANDPTAIAQLKRQLQPPLGADDEAAARDLEVEGMETAVREGTLVERVGRFVEGE